MGDDALRNGLKDAAKVHLSGWGKKLTPHVLRHFCASQLHGSGLDLLANQEVLGHSWIATTMRYIHVQQTRGEDARAGGDGRAAVGAGTVTPAVIHKRRDGRSLPPA
ncbi:tyrosine-type recombinase/integrase [Streptomyces spongiae]|uniref:tyrosine-type recombinase/integrase n=1 Tax=Streptomyces spongiae TaxID=565072 RepID=UPI002AD4709F|nr:tyrosine-type recombinase/integrase [Streptomyces spongiae]